MAVVLDKGIASKLKNSFQSTPGISREQVQAFATLLAALEKPGISSGEAERELREWVAKAPRHAITVVRSAALGCTYMRRLPSDSWILNALGAAGPPR